MSGCFDGAIGEAEADDDITDSTPNNESNEMFCVSVMADENTPTGCEEGGYDYCYLMYEFNTNSSQLVEVIAFYVGGMHSSENIHTDCGNGFEGYISYDNGIGNMNYLPFSDMECTHTVTIGFSYMNDEPRSNPAPYFSLVYQIHEVTVL